jgi:hypothetical protein
MKEKREGKGEKTEGIMKEESRGKGMGKGKKELWRRRCKRRGKRKKELWRRRGKERAKGKKELWKRRVNGWGKRKKALWRSRGGEKEWRERTGIEEKSRKRAKRIFWEGYGKGDRKEKRSELEKTRVRKWGEKGGKKETEMV